VTVDVVAYGETMGLLDGECIGPLRLGGTMRLSIAGAESTVAIGVARLGGTARWVRVIGDDEIGDLITRILRAERVRTDGVVVHPDAPTGLLLMERRTSTVSRIRYYRHGFAGSRLCAAHVRPDHIAAARILHVSGITPALSPSARDATFHALEVAKSAATLRSVDVNHRARLWQPSLARGVLADMVKHADIVFATLEEAALVTNTTPNDPATAAESIARHGPQFVAVKMGADGAVAWHDGRIDRAAPPPTVVVDPVGAGDSFAAGLLAEVARGLRCEQALATAASTAAVGVACPGDWEGLPTRAEVDLVGSGDVVR
jgi:2-dehydro-3-deoxygluconokinase